MRGSGWVRAGVLTTFGRLSARCRGLICTPNGSISLAGATLWRDDGVVVGSGDDRPCAGAGPGADNQACVVKQVDRLLSNNGIDVWDSFARWVPHQIASRAPGYPGARWTGPDFDHDDQATLVLGVGGQPRPCGSAAVADRVEGRTQESAQRL